MQHRRRLGELDLAVVDDLYVIAPGVEEVQAAGLLHRYAGVAQGGADDFLVGDDQPEVARAVRRLRPAGGQREELIAHVDEGHPRTGTAAQAQLEEAPVPGERAVEVSDLERMGLAGLEKTEAARAELRRKGIAG